jgi:hypothetical protein
MVADPGELTPPLDRSPHCSSASGPSASRHARLRWAWLAPVLLYILLRTVYLQWGAYYPSDSRWSVHTAVSILHQGNTDLNEYADLMKGGIEADYTLHKVGERIYTRYPVGASVLALPYVALFDAYAQVLTGQGVDAYLREYGAGRLERLIASSLTALAMAFLYLLLRHHLVWWAALGLSLAYGLGTSAWSTGALALWQHTPTLLLLTLTLWLLDLACERPALVQFAGLTLALSFVCRPTTAIVILLVTAYVAWRQRPYLWRYLAWAAPVAVAFVAYSETTYGRLLPPYYLMQGIGTTANLWEGLAGTLISPNRGLFIWTPILLIAFYGLFLRIRGRSFRRFDGLWWGSIALHWLLISGWSMWWGGHSLGPRFFTEMLPFYAYLTVPVLQHLPGQRAWGRAVTGALLLGSALFGLAVQYHVVADEGPARWNAQPTNVDIAPSRLWNWRDLQFLRHDDDVPEPMDGVRISRTPWFEFDTSVPGKGWSDHERDPFGQTYTWMDKKRSTLYIDVGRPSDLDISIRVLNWLDDGTLASLELTLDDRPIALQRSFDAQGAALFGGRVPADAFAPRRRYHVLAFRVDRVLSPAVKDPQSADPRKLALALDWIKLLPADARP